MQETKVITIKNKNISLINKIDCAPLVYRNKEYFLYEAKYKDETFGVAYCEENNKIHPAYFECSFEDKRDINVSFVFLLSKNIRKAFYIENNNWKQAFESKAPMIDGRHGVVKIENGKEIKARMKWATNLGVSKFFEEYFNVK